MIRPLTCITLLMAACSGLYLYQTKARTLGVDREIARTLKIADTTWQRASVLRAEYTLLNDPSRLADLATQYLSRLQTTAPGQFSTWADLDKRLPPVGPPPAPPEPAPDVTAPVAASPADNPEVAHLEQPRREPQRDEPSRTEPAAAEAQRPVATPQRPPAPAPVAVAANPKPVPLVPPRVQTPATRPAPTPLPVTQVAVIHPTPTTTTPAVVRSPGTPPPMVGSALGMARTMRLPASDTASGMR